MIFDIFAMSFSRISCKEISTLGLLLLTKLSHEEKYMAEAIDHYILVKEIYSKIRIMKTTVLQINPHSCVQETRLPTVSQQRQQCVICSGKMCLMYL